VALLERIHHLLYTQGYTIKGVQKLLREQGKAQIIAQADNQNTEDQSKAKHEDPVNEETKRLSPEQRAIFESLLNELKTMRAMLKV